VRDIRRATRKRYSAEEKSVEAESAIDVGQDRSHHWWRRGIMEFAALLFKWHNPDQPRTFV